MRDSSHYCIFHQVLLPKSIYKPVANIIIKTIVGNTNSRRETLMRFGMLYELKPPKPWKEDSELNLVHDAIDQCVLGNKLDIDFAWSVKNCFLEEYSHCSASELFLSAISAKT